MTYNRGNTNMSKTYALIVKGKQTDLDGITVQNMSSEQALFALQYGLVATAYLIERGTEGVDKDADAIVEQRKAGEHASHRDIMVSGKTKDNFVKLLRLQARMVEAVKALAESDAKKAAINTTATPTAEPVEA